MRYMDVKTHLFIYFISIYHTLFISEQTNTLLSYTNIIYPVCDFLINNNLYIPI